MCKFDCSRFIKDCHASCCGNFPIEKIFYEKNLDKIITQPIKIEEYYEPDPFDNIKKYFVLPLTESNKCCFVRSDYSCAIYDERPEVCKLYGGESRPYLFCHWQDRNGKKRSRQARRLLHRSSKKFYSKYIKARKNK